MTSPSDKAEAERRYSGTMSSAAYPFRTIRAAFLDGIKFAEESAAVSVQRLLQLAADESWRREYQKDARRETFMAGAVFVLNALASEAGPAQARKD